MSYNNKPAHPQPLPTSARHQQLRTIFFIFSVWAIGLMSLYSSPTQAHPIEFHAQPLDAKTIERVIESIDGMISEVEANGFTVSIDTSDGNVGVALMMWSLQSAVLAVDESDTIDSPVLRQAISSAGYAESAYMVEEWQADTQQVLETYEVIRQGLNSAMLQARYAAFNKALPTLDKQQAIEIESALIQDAELLRTTAVDRPLVKKYESQLEALATRMGVSGK